MVRFPFSLSLSVGIATLFALALQSLAEPTAAQGPPGCERETTLWAIGPNGIYEVNTRTGAVTKRSGASGVTIAAGFAPYQLIYTDANNNVYAYDIRTRASTGPLLGSPLPGLTKGGLGNGWDSFLYNGISYLAGGGQLFRLSVLPALGTPPWPMWEIPVLGTGGLALGDVARDPLAMMGGRPLNPLARVLYVAVTAGTGGGALNWINPATGAAVKAPAPFLFKSSGAPLPGIIDGLAFRQDGELFVLEDCWHLKGTPNPCGPGVNVMARIYHVGNRIPANCVLAAVEEWDQLTDLASEPALYCTEPVPPPEWPWGDLGDAPDSTNHRGLSMTAYGGVMAAFPTVHELIEWAPSGPKHIGAWHTRLGLGLSIEQEADTFGDEDGVWNLVPERDASDQDGLDDALAAPMALPHCSQTSFAFWVRILGEAEEARWLNAWLDWNRDGDWGDTVSCVDPQSGQLVTVAEHVVDNWSFVRPMGDHQLTTPSFWAYDPTPGGAIWLRLTVTREATTSPDGRGLQYPYVYVDGETEDYRLVYRGNGEYGP